MNSLNYEKGMLYEAFIKNVYKASESNSRNGAFSAYMQYLLEAEDGNNLSVLSKKKQFDNVKKYLKKALDKLESKRIKTEQMIFLKQLKNDLDNAISGYDLCEIVTKASQLV